MFTGLVQGVGRVQGLTPSEGGVRLSIAPGGWPEKPSPGDSVSVAGVCLTVAAPVDGAETMEFDVIPETLRMTTLGDLSQGDSVNLESSLRVGQTMGGHFVQGHVDGVGSVLAAGQEGGEYRVRVKPPTTMLPLLAPKGAITVDGVSLTIADSQGDWFDVALIPTTLRETTLCDLAPGDSVNLESDMLARAVVRALSILNQHAD